MFSRGLHAGAISLSISGCRALGASEYQCSSRPRRRVVCCCKKNRCCGFLGQLTISGSSGVLNYVSFVRTKPVELSLGKLPLRVCCAVFCCREVYKEDMQHSAIDSFARLIRCCCSTKRSCLGFHVHLRIEPARLPCASMSLGLCGVPNGRPDVNLAVTVVHRQ